jgi:hypothetical protein
MGSEVSFVKNVIFQTIDDQEGLVSAMVGEARKTI